MRGGKAGSKAWTGVVFGRRADHWLRTLLSCCGHTPHAQSDREEIFRGRASGQSLERQARGAALRIASQNLARVSSQLEGFTVMCVAFCMNDVDVVGPRETPRSAS